MDTERQILAPQPVNLIHNTGGDYCRITLAVTCSGMKITTVALDAKLRPVGDVTENEIEPKGSRTGLTFVLPPDAYLIIRDLPELI